MAQPDCVYDELRLTSSGFSRLAHFVTAELGIKMPESKIAMVKSRLLRRVRELGCDSIETYLDQVFTGANSDEERWRLIDAITTNKTDFFREPEHFDFLTETALPRLAAARVRVWSAGCSSGEEPYTLAMILSEYAEQRPGFAFDILATDVSTRVLQHARSGIYEESAAEAVAPWLRRKYFLRSKDRSRGVLRIRPELRQLVSFHRLNFMQSDYCIRDRFEAIFFRNVLIYFDKPTQEAVLNKVCRYLVPGGYLFISHSESLAGLAVPVVPLRAAVFRKPAAG